MGIVVSISMLLGLVGVSTNQGYYRLKELMGMTLLMTFLVGTGLWNSVWYGFQNIHTFWGLAALVSGLFILFSAVIIYTKEKITTSKHSLCDNTKQLIRYLVIVGLGLCFFLYTVTIIQINLSMPIIG